MNKKTVVQAWAQKALNHRQTQRSGFWGIGDLLRGSNVLFNTCETLGIAYALDIRGHPICSIFLPTTDLNGMDTAEVEFWTFDSYEEVSERIAMALERTNVVTLNTNGGPAWPDEPSDNWRSFIKGVLRPNSLFEKHLADAIPSHPYNAFHFRLGDSSLVRGERSQLDDAVEALDRYGEAEDIIITDSPELQDFVRLHRPSYRVSNARPVHTGLSTDIDAIAQTMCDFFLIGRASIAKSYSVYPGPSGFVVSASRIFDVPVVPVSYKVLRPKKSTIKKVLGLLHRKP